MGKTNFPDGISDAGVSTVRQTVEITGPTLEIDTGLLSVAGCVPALAEDPGAGAGDVASVTYENKGSGKILLKIWQDDATAATEDTTVSFIAWGPPRPE